MSDAKIGADRPAKVEVTSEMVSAGVAALVACDVLEDSYDEIVTEVFQAMSGVAAESRDEPSRFRRK